MLPSYSKLNGKQKWAINKLHRVTKTTAALIIYCDFADPFLSKEIDIDLRAYIFTFDFEDSDTRKDRRKRIVKSWKELQDLELVVSDLGLRSRLAK